MTSKSLGTSLEASLDFKFHHLKSLKSRTREQGFKLSAGRNFRRFVVGPVILAFLLSPAVFAAGFCSGGSAIEQVPFFVGQSYYDIFDRVPDGPGERNWIGQLESLNTRACKSANPVFSAGSCEWNNAAQVALAFLDSAEFTSKNGSLTSNDAFVTALYKTLLRRNPDNPGLRSHVSTLSSGGTRLGMVLAFLTSEEYRHRFTCTATGTSNPSCRGAASVDPVPAFVAQTHRDLLGREPDSASLASWTTYMTSHQVALCQNVSATAFSACDRVVEVQMIMDALNGSAYQKSNPPIADNKAFVTALYKHLLQRAPAEAGLQSHLTYLDQTNDRLGTIYRFLTGDEYRKRFSCYAGDRDHMNLGITGHPINQPAYSDADGVSYDEQLTQVRNAGAQWYRFDVGATSGPDTGGDFAKMDVLVSKAQSHGVHLLPILFPSVDLAHDTPVAIYSKSYDGAFKFVTRYKSSIHVWELSNERDIYSLAGGGGEQINEYNPQKYAAVAAMLRGLSEGVRAADGNALRVINFAGWLHTGFFQRLEDDQVPYDIAGIHWYQTMGEITCPGQTLPCPANPQHFNVVQRVQKITNGKPIWVTETNYTPLPANSPEMNISRKEKYLAAVLQTYLGSPAVYPFQTVMVYELLDEPNFQSDVTQSQMGMFSVAPSAGRKYALGAPKPEYHILRNLSGR
jgi:hypothetical protein